MIQETVKATGALQIKLYGPDGQLKQEQSVKNLVVTDGKGYIASRMVSTPTAMSHMGIGTGTVAPVIGNPSLGTQVARVTLTSSAAVGAVVTYIALFGSTVGTGAITEAGIFNAATAGTMLCRTVFPVVNKGADDSLTITWTITVS